MPHETSSRTEDDATAGPRLAGPLYFQIRELILERIDANEWPDGRFLPNEGDLARAYGVSVGTMRKALELLGQEKRIVRRQGLGTYVIRGHETFVTASRPWSQTGQPGNPPDIKILACLMVEPEPQEAGHLKIGSSEKALQIQAICTEDGKAISADRYLLPLSGLPGSQTAKTSGNPEIPPPAELAAHLASTETSSGAA